MSTPPQARACALAAEDAAGLSAAAPAEVAEYIEDMLAGMEALARRSRLDRLRAALTLARAEARRSSAN